MTRFELINTVGIPVKKGIIQQSQTSIDATSYSNGMHFIRITKDDLRPLTLSIVVQKL